MLCFNPSPRKPKSLSLSPDGWVRQRELIINTCSDYFRAGSDAQQVPSMEKAMVLMIRLMRVSNNTAKICSNPAVLWDIAVRIDALPDSDNTTLLRFFERLVELILVPIAKMQSETRYRAFLSDFTEMLLSALETLSSYERHIGTLILLKVSVPVLVQHGDTLIGTSAVVHRHVEVLRASAAACLDVEEKLLKPISVHLSEAVIALPADTRLSSRMLHLTLLQRSCLTLLAADVVDQYKSLLADKKYSINDQQKVSLFGLHALTMSPSELFQYGLSLFPSGLPPLLYAKIRNPFADVMSNIADEEKAAVALASGAGLLSVTGSQFVEIIVKLLRPPEDGLESSKARMLLDEPLSHLSSLSNPRTLDNCFVCVDVALQDKPSLLIQSSIETLVSQLFALTCPSAPPLPTDLAKPIYSNMCNTLTLIISLHRKSLHRRFHILLPLLERLLTCLYIPFHGRNNNTSSSGSKLSHPPWLDAREHPLARQQAALFTRVLTTLCEPTLSSVSFYHHHHNHSRGKSSAPLTDPIKQYRAYTSQFMTNVLARYCSLQLQGTLDPKVRTGLMPGIWSVMGTVEVEHMRAMRAGLGQAEREVWGGLFEDWKGGKKRKFE
ncbi:hypothetical protein K402DRAFT_244185 [Aulographum hederae CBS 113979]|uniref:Nucleolar 27S pre-rRNA processing Urb2/Npa2 C-terminal domain-containing protein n=1 Tax=Aulographum hederae CBS 113979 TaxID=1176131 RepID=A0A6G1HA72_9PEZI|nr:hypothetical protein K402DRAFT_244185 [Aulographum hederae CBS 113979]